MKLTIHLRKNNVLRCKRSPSSHYRIGCIILFQLTFRTGNIYNLRIKYHTWSFFLKAQNPTHSNKLINSSEDTSDSITDPEQILVRVPFTMIS